MACVTLKRPVEALGSPHHMEHEPMVKRRRCGMSLFPTTPPGTNSGPYGLPEGGHPTPSSSRHHTLCGSPINHLNRGVKRAKRKLDIDHYSCAPSSPPVSPFMSATPPLETGKLVAQLGQELKRIQRRNQGIPSSQIPGQSPSNSGKEQPLFTLKQVTIACQRMIKEREELLRNEYDKALSTKLAEQYDTFVKFSHDQVERRLTESAFSYVS